MKTPFDNDIQSLNIKNQNELEALYNYDIDTLHQLGVLPNVDDNLELKKRILEFLSQSLIKMNKNNKDGNNDGNDGNNSNA